MAIWLAAKVSIPRSAISSVLLNTIVATVTALNLYFVLTDGLRCAVLARNAAVLGVHAGGEIMESPFCGIVLDGRIACCVVRFVEAKSSRLPSSLVGRRRD